MASPSELRAQRTELERLIEERQRLLGPDHPDLAHDLRDLDACRMSLAR